MTDKEQQKIGIWQHYACKTVTSTNDVAREYMRESLVPILITAAYQTEGRGQHGRRWESPANTNILITFAHPIQSVSHAHVSLAAGIAVCTALRAYSCNALCKWPNDVLINNRKIAGILIEKDDANFYIGIGINIQYPAQRTTDRTSCHAEGIEILKRELIEGIAQKLPALFSENSDTILSEYRKVWSGKGRTIIIRAENMPGIIQDIDESGALIVHCKGEKHKIYSSNALRYITDELHIEESLAARSA